MNVDYIYNKASGRMLVKAMQKSGAFRLASCFLKSKLSKKMVKRYIERNDIDMSDFKDQDYESFAEFFSRKKDSIEFVSEPDVLISPCDSLLSYYEISEDMTINMKGSYYKLTDLIPDQNAARQVVGGICLVFRLQASDYHHFCAIDDAIVAGHNFVQGELHSVQPIACETVPVYRLNRRWWSVLNTENFGSVIQIEVGAMLVGGVKFSCSQSRIRKGSDMGNFEIAGSTTIIMLSGDTAKRLSLYDKFKDAKEGKTEVKVRIGEGIGVVDAL